MNMRGIHRVRRRTAGGETFYYYAWRGGPQFWKSDRPVAEPPPEVFRQAFEAARTRRAPELADDSATMAELIASFKEKAMPADRSTRETYDSAFRLIAKEFGKARLRMFADPRMRREVKAWHLKFREHPRAADMKLGALVRLLNWAKDEGLIAGHVCGDIEHLHKVDRSDIIWEPAEVERFCADAPFELWLACQLLRFTGLRRGDACRLPVTADKGQWLEWTTSKRGVPVVVPIVQQFRTVLDEAKRRRDAAGVKAPTILFNSRGRPWTPMGLSTSFDRRREALGIAKTMHDLRGTAATEFMQVGMNDEEVAEIIGWSATDIRRIRRRYVSRAAIVSAAIARLERNAR